MRMSKKDAEVDFKENVRPYIISEYGTDDVTAMREAWNNYTDMLCKDGQISNHQYETWDHPRFIK